MAGLLFVPGLDSLPRMRMFLVRITRTPDKKSCDAVIMAASRESAIGIVRKNYELGDDYDVVEMMSWGPNTPVRITGQY